MRPKISTAFLGNWTNKNLYNIYIYISSPLVAKSLNSGACLGSNVSFVNIV